jgi:hypothetical protein
MAIIDFAAVSNLRCISNIWPSVSNDHRVVEWYCGAKYAYFGLQRLVDVDERFKIIRGYRSTVDTEGVARGSRGNERGLLLKGQSEDEDCYYAGDGMQASSTYFKENGCQIL